jgi:hypothetical protein
MPPLTPHEPKMSTRDSDFHAKVKDAIEMVGDIDLCFDTDFAILEAMDVETLANHLRERARIYAADQSAAKSWIADLDARNRHKPTPTIPQMTDRHERQVFTDKAERVVNKVLAFALTVLAVVFVGGLMYKTFVWGH